MQKIINITTGIYGIVTALIIGNITLTVIYNPHDFLQPLGNKFSVSTDTIYEVPEDNVIYGFLPYWTLQDAEYIQLDKITDIAYFALHIEASGEIRKTGEDGNLDPGYNNWRNNEKLDELIARGKKYNTRFSLTIISHEADISDSFLHCEECWDTLLTDLKKEMDYKEIYNINLDFEYADYTDEEIADQYTKLAGYLNTELDKEYGNAYLVVSTFADSVIKPRVTKPGELAKVVDGLFIMAYDFHRPTSDSAGPVAPIGGTENGREYDINTMLKDYLAVATPNKLILGVPYYGYNWVVEDFEPDSARIEGNDYIGYSRSQKYEDVMEVLLEYSPEEGWDEQAKAPFFTYISEDSGSIRTVYYENDASLKEKYKLAKSHGLGGVGIWALGYDGGYQELWNLLASEFPYVLGAKKSIAE